MKDLSVIEESFQKYIKDLYKWIPEGIYTVDLALLHRFDLLHFQPDQEKQSHGATHFFHLFESSNKITLINDEFVVWIIPGSSDQSSMTVTLIGLNKEDKEPSLEAAFIASGVYNNSNLVMKILEGFLADIHETETTLGKLEKLS